MAASGRSRQETRDWRQLASLGEQLRRENSFTAQRDRIVAMTARLVSGRAEVWLDEALFRLPDWEDGRVFPPQPPRPGMKRVIKTGRPFTQAAPRGSASRLSFSAAPLQSGGVILGALQVTRSRGPAFAAPETALLQELAQMIADSLFASHRAEIEQFRLRQLNLVREVSTQIANVLDVDELSARVTQLIRQTFKYYYVSIFTVEPDSNTLRFRSSAFAPRKGRRKAAVAPSVEMGQGLVGEAALHGRPIVCDDAATDPRFRFYDGLPETRSEVVIPLKIEERVLGVLDVQSDQRKAFHPNDLLVLHALADNIARAVDGARLYSGLRRRADQMSLVSEVSRCVTSTLDLQRSMGEAATLIHEKFGYPHVSIFTVHPNRRLISYEAGSGSRSARMEGYAISLDEPDGILPWAARNGGTLLVNDVSKYDRYLPSPFPPKNTRSEICVPLIFNDEVLGLLDIQSERLNAFSDDDQVMFESLADTMAAAIRNADLYRSEQWRRQVADSLREVAGLVSANVGMDEVLETILLELDRSLPIDISAVWLLQDGELYLSAVHGADPARLQEVCASNPEAIYAMAEALSSSVPIIRRPDDPLWPSGLSAGFDQNYSSIAAPLRVGERPLGVLTLAHHTPGRYGHEARGITATLASYASVSIENARLYDAAQEQAYASAALLQVAQAVVSLSDVDEILGTITRIMPILVGVRRAALYRWDMDRSMFRATHEYGFFEEGGGRLTDQDFVPGEFPLLDAAFEQNSMLLHFVQPDAGPASWLKIRPGARRESEGGHLLMAVPLSIKNDTFGVMLIEEAGDGRRFRARRIEIINGIAQQAALAIQNDLLQQEMVVRERLETEAQLARSIQQTFIPQSLPLHDSWQFAARWRTARQVGGDFYDVIQLPDGRIGVFIADVSDKGMPAALFMALTRTLVRAAVNEQTSPVEVLRHVNEQLLPDTHSGMFVTAVYGVLDPQNGMLTYVNAGHNPPFFVHADGTVEKLARTAMALGVAEQPGMQERSIVLAPGEAILLYTDGLTEAFAPDGEIFGDARVMAALVPAHAETADGLLVRVEDRLNEFIDTIPLGDDLTMLSIKRV